MFFFYIFSQSITKNKLVLLVRKQVLHSESDESFVKL